MNPQDLRQLIQQTLTPFNLYSPIAEELLIATACNESLMGKFRTQEDGGPARGVFQEEGEDFNDLVNNYLHYRPELLAQVKALSTNFCVDDLVTNDALAVAICRLHYYRSPMTLPSSTAPTDLWSVYKAVYNTAGGKAKEPEFLQNYALYSGT